MVEGSLEERQNAFNEGIKMLDDFVGQKNVKAQIRKLVDLNNPFPSKYPHLVFVGPSGCGKLTMARIVSKLYYGLGICKKDRVVEVERHKLVSGYIGGSAVKTKKVVEDALGGILYIECAYDLATDMLAQEALDQLLVEMEDHRDDLVVIFEGFEKPMDQFLDNNPGLASRFTNIIKFENYTNEDLIIIFKAMCKKKGLILKDELVDELTIAIDLERKKDVFQNARTLRLIFEKVYENYCVRVSDIKNPSKEELQTLEEIDFRGGYQMTPEEALNSIMESFESWPDVGTYKMQIKQLVKNYKVDYQRKLAGLPVQQQNRNLVLSGGDPDLRFVLSSDLPKLLYGVGFFPTLDVPFVTTYDSDLLSIDSNYIGKPTEIMRNLIEKSVGGVLYIDNASDLLKNIEALDTLLYGMEEHRNDVVFILSDTSEGIKKLLESNEGLKARLKNIISFE